MAQSSQNQELIDRFGRFFRNYYRDEISRLAQRYPNEQRSLYVDYDDLYTFDPDLAEDYRSQPDQLREYAEEALRLYDLPADVKLGQAHVRVRNLDDHIDIRDIRVHDDHVGKLVSVQGIVRKATDVRPKITEAAFECQRCGTMTYIPQTDGSFQEPHECQGCERQGPFRVNYDQSEFVDSQKLRIQESPEGLRGGETPQNIDVDIEDDITGKVTAGDHVTVTGVLHIEQQGSDQEKSAIFDLYMDGVSVEIEDEEFEDMDITEEDVREIVELSDDDDIYERMVGSVAPSIYGYDQEKLAMILQLFSGVTKHLPDGSRIRGDLHMLLIGDPGTGKCVHGDTAVTLADGTDAPIRDVVESHLDDPTPVDDGVFQDVDFPVPSLAADGTVTHRRATKVWKREAPDHLYRIRTARGRELEVTPSHPLFTSADGRPRAVKAAQLDEGTFVATPRRIPTEADDRLDVDYRRAKSPNAVRLDLPEAWTPRLARLVAYLIAEGHVVRNDDDTADARVTNNDREILDDVATAFDELGLNWTEDGPRRNKTARRVRCSASEFVSFLEEIEPAILDRSAEQRVPDAIARASADIKRAFLKAYVDCEGTVSRTQREIAVASTSRELLTGVRSLLTSLGIDSQLQERNGGSYRLRLSGADFAEYVDTVGFVTERKSLAADAHADVPTNTNTDVVPNVGDELRRVREALALSQFDCGLPRSTYQHYERGDRNPSRESLLTVVEAFERRLDELRNLRDELSSVWADVERARKELNLTQRAIADELDVEQTTISYYERETPVADGGRVLGARDVVDDRLDDALSVAGDVSALRDVAESDVRWDRIELIERVDPDEEWVYDLEVEGTHSYLSNGVVSHNSQLLSYIQNVAPRSVYTSGKGSSSAGLTAAAVRDDFSDGQQWTLEAGALVLADKGIAAIDELDKMRCVTGDTLVHLGDGRIRRIGELARDAAEAGSIESLPNGRTIRDVDLDAWTMTDDGRLVRRSVTALHEYDAPGEMTEVRLESGETLTSTDDHPYFVFEDGSRVEKSAAALDPGDWVYVPRALPPVANDGGVAATARTTDGDSAAAFGAVLGYLSGDGNIFYSRAGGSYGIRFTNSEERLLADFERACRAAFDAEPSRPPSEQRDDGVETVRLSGKAYADAVLDAGMNLETYDGKAFPTGVTDLSREAKAAFVRALADSEGTVDTRTGNVRICSASRELLRGTKSLLLEFGVSCQIQTRPRPEKRDLYVLAITAAESLAAYDRHVGFTLDRKQSALESVRESVSGDRTILDVVPDVDNLLQSTRESLRLHQSECGLPTGTYADFERGRANVSIRRARSILDAFGTRRRNAEVDLERLATPCSWSTLAELKEAYHVSQAELADGTDVSQSTISTRWGDDELRSVVRERLRDVVTDVAETELDALRSLVRGDVKWRRVDAVESVPATDVDDRLAVLRNDLATRLGCPASNAESRGRSLLDRDVPVPDSWDDLWTELDRYDVSYASLAADLDVAPSTVSRWFRGVVDTDRFDEVRDAALERIGDQREAIADLLDAVDARTDPKVYDLTVEGTHNFVANGLVVHNSEDRSAMHEGLEQQQISVSKAGINATLKSRCSLLGAANPKYGRFDQYEPIGEQIDLEPALISRFDLIFTVTDQPDPEKDANLADHILQTNYAGELNTQRTRMTNSEYTQEQVDDVTEDVAPDIDPDLMRKYIAYAKRSCFPAMSDEAKAAIREFYVDLRAKGTDEDAPVPVTARKLEALVRLSEASARVRLSDTVEREDAERVIEIVRSCLQDIGVDPETGQFDADVVETGTSKSQRDRIKNLKQLIADIEEDYEEGAPVDKVLERADEIGMDRSRAEDEIEKLKTRGELYEPNTDHLRTT
ncbi:MAG: LAGLIDADG family homing endonuclease [Haloferacaceae archaeon]